ncbi:hypothetical protein H8356DRAFT_1374253 [Neocallimastix lanati (nom. inval.)]|nr:hypothetical protein H8356DRAFT_1374253 [Neocallimastix sp. JGI-2020a]
MLQAYYSFTESKITVFDDKKISKSQGWNKHLGKYNVIKLDMANIFYDNNMKDGIGKIKKTIIDDVKMNDKHFKCNKKEDIDVIIEKIYRRTQRKIVLIIDEWDLVFRDTSCDTKSKKDYLNFLTLLIKNNENIVLTYMTGILPIKTKGLSPSIKGIFNEFSMTSNSHFDEYFGFTKDDVEELCRKYLSTEILDNPCETEIPINKNKNIDKNKDRIIAINNKMIKDWYNGYQFTNQNDGKEYDLYIPYSVIQTIKNKKIDNYWIKTESNAVFLDYVVKDLKGEEKDIALLMNKGRLKVKIDAYRSDVIENKDTILTVLIHLGYLAYDSKSKNVYIPNKEIKQKFWRSKQMGSN